MPETVEPHVPPEVAECLQHYVYLYVDPRTSAPFYVGKGQGARVLAHLGSDDDDRKATLLREIQDAGLEPRLEILAHGLPDEETAFRIEAAAIDVLGLGTLTNRMRGWKSVQFGRLSLDELVAYYAAEPVEVAHPALLIRINRLYQHGMDAEALYEATRGVWRLSPRRERAGFALAVFEGVVREVYRIDSWHRAGTTAYRTRNDTDRPDRWEFLGAVAEAVVRERYRLRSVAAYFRKGQQAPVVYVNC